MKGLQIISNLKVRPSDSVIQAETLVSQHSDAQPKLRLVALISIDQFRADYLTRFEGLYLPATSAGKVGGRITILFRL